MQIKVFNCPDKKFKPYVEEATRFYANELIENKRILKNCHVAIRFDGKMDMYGFADIVEVNTKNKPRGFLIELHPGIGAKNILSTLAHEMVHVKQYINGELNDEMTLWKGKKVDSDKMDYWVHPWEIEAYGIEAGLLYKFVIMNQLCNIFQDFKDPVTPIVSTPIKWK